MNAWKRLPNFRRSEIDLKLSIAYAWHSENTNGLVTQHNTHAADNWTRITNGTFLQKCQRQQNSKYKLPHLETFEILYSTMMLIELRRGILILLCSQLCNNCICFCALWKDCWSERPITHWFIDTNFSGSLRQLNTIIHPSLINRIFLKASYKKG